MATCPSGAITGVGVSAAALTREAEDLSAAMRVSCAPARLARSRNNEERGFSVSCLAALHPESVVATAFALRPGAALTLTRSLCSDCPTAQRARVDVVIEKSMDLLARVDDGHRRILVTTSSAEADESQPDGEASPGRARRGQWTRRELFTGGRSRGRAVPPRAVTPARAELFSHSSNPSLVTLQLTHPTHAPGCTLCRACAMVCPTQAMRLESLAEGGTESGSGSGQRSLTVDPDCCVGCGRCAEVCVDDLLMLGLGPKRPTTRRAPTARSRLIVLARGEESACETCQQPLTPGEQGACSRCESAAVLVSDVLAR